MPLGWVVLITVLDWLIVAGSVVGCTVVLLFAVTIGIAVILDSVVLLLLILLLDLVALLISCCS